MNQGEEDAFGWDFWGGALAVDPAHGNAEEPMPHNVLQGLHAFDSGQFAVKAEQIGVGGGRGDDDMEDSTLPSGGATPDPTGDEPPRKLRRREQNRIHSRNSREKKRNYTGALEQKVSG